MSQSLKSPPRTIPPTPKSSTFFRPLTIFLLAIALRLALLAWGRHQDATSPLKYTDIDYLVFTDAARFISRSQSPYARDTYRYTPLLAWLLYPTSWPGSHWFDFGKVVFALGDVVTGWLIYLILRKDGRGLGEAKAMKYACIWLLNPMVANISTRGSSEGLVAVIVVALLWAVLEGKIRLAGWLLGLGVHFKIYPFIYAGTVFWYLGEERGSGGVRPGWKRYEEKRTWWTWIRAFANPQRLELVLYSFVTFMGLNALMYKIYGWPFVEHSYTYHFTRIDHRHNFSIYNTLLHYRSATGTSSGVQIESVAFVPQLLLSVFAMPVLLGKKDLAGTMLAQTFAFVTFNKVCTSQYFLWYMVFLPFYLPRSSFIRKPALGVTALVAWVVGQALWLQQGYELEFLGKSRFVVWLYLATMVFFAINCWILGIIVSDIGGQLNNLSELVSEPKKNR